MMAFDRISGAATRALISAFGLLAIFTFAGVPRAHAASRAVASYYGYETYGRTANGERFNPRGFTAASKTLPFGTRLRVSYRGRSVVVRVNDRGPFVRGRSLDLSYGAARAIGLTGAGVGVVTVERLS
jgi:rare lipoprotein A